MNKVIIVLAYIASGILLLTGIQWQIDPAATAANLGMTLMDGVGRSTQVGDLTSFFVVGGAFGLAGLITKNKTLLYTPAALVAGAALFRTTTAMFHGAPFASQIVIEVVMLVIFVLAASRLQSN